MENTIGTTRLQISKYYLQLSKFTDYIIARLLKKLYFCIEIINIVL